MSQGANSDSVDAPQVAAANPAADTLSLEPPVPVAPGVNMEMAQVADGGILPDLTLLDLEELLNLDPTDDSSPVGGSLETEPLQTAAEDAAPPADQDLPVDLTAVDLDVLLDLVLDGTGLPTLLEVAELSAKNRVGEGQQDGAPDKDKSAVAAIPGEDDDDSDVQADGKEDIALDTLFNDEDVSPASAASHAGSEGTLDNGGPGSGGPGASSHSTTSSGQADGAYGGAAPHSNAGGNSADAGSNSGTAAGQSGSSGAGGTSSNAGGNSGNVGHSSVSSNGGGNSGNNARGNSSSSNAGGNSSNVSSNNAGGSLGNTLGNSVSSNAGDNSGGGAAAVAIAAAGITFPGGGELPVSIAPNDTTPGVNPGHAIPASVPAAPPVPGPPSHAAATFVSSSDSGNGLGNNSHAAVNSSAPDNNFPVDNPSPPVDIVVADIPVTIAPSSDSGSTVPAVTVEPGVSLKGSGSDDVMTGGAGDDSLNGLGGNDTLNGLAGNDTLSGAGGNDYLDGGAGADVLSGGGGSDVLVWDFNDINIDGGGGSDTLRVVGGDADITTFGGTITGIENVDLASDAGANALTLSAQDVLDMSGTDTLTVSGDALDSVDAGTGWNDGGISGGDHIYTQVIGPDTATLVVDTALAVNANILV